MWTFKREAKLMFLILFGPIVISLLLALCAPRMFGKTGKAKQQAAYYQIELFERSLNALKKDTGRYPNSLEGLEALIKNPIVEGWRGL